MCRGISDVIQMIVGVGMVCSRRSVVKNFDYVIRDSLPGSSRDEECQKNGC